MVRIKNNRKIFKEGKRAKSVKKVLKVLFLLLSAGVTAAFFVFLYYAKDLPRPEKFTEKQMIQPTEIYDRTGKTLLYRIYGEEKRELVNLEEIPKYLQQAVVATEDANFYSHYGVDFKGIIRAVLLDLVIQEPKYGGSTLSQQLIRSSFLTLDKTISRKIKELILTLELERRYSKDEILGFYLNQIPLGENAYGMAAASKTYFGKPVSEVSLPEAAVLASLIKGPSYYSPYGSNIEDLFTRKDYVLDRMEEEGYISKEEAEEAKSVEIVFMDQEKINPFSAPHFILVVKQYLIEKYGESYLHQKGLKVYTTLDLEMQKETEEAVEYWGEINADYNANNAAAVVLDPVTGEILAMVGSKDYSADPWPEGCNANKNECLFSPEFNVVTLGERQPGSAFKPFAYFTLFQKGITPEISLWDVETNFGLGTEEYIPKNYDGKFRGEVTIRQALAQSLNIPSVKVFYLAGQENTLNTAKSFGISTLNEPYYYYGLPLVLGGGEVNLMEMASAYGVFATEGYKAAPSFILKIEDSENNIIEKSNNEAKKIVKSDPCRIINDVLSDNEARYPIFSRNSSLYFESFPVAAKTGTTQDYKDAWAIGYTPSVVVGVWIGNNNSSSMHPLPSMTLSGPLFHQIMEKALVLYPSTPFQEPDDYKERTDEIKNRIDEENTHSILHYIDKDDPLGPIPENPSDDPQYEGWEKGIQNWLE